MRVTQRRLREIFSRLNSWSCSIFTLYVGRMVKVRSLVGMASGRLAPDEMIQSGRRACPLLRADNRVNWQTADRSRAGLLPPAAAQPRRLVRDFAGAVAQRLRNPKLIPEGGLLLLSASWQQRAEWRGQNCQSPTIGPASRRPRHSAVDLSSRSSSNPERDVDSILFSTT